MSLNSCPDCNHPVSNDASFCPSCGHPFDSQPLMVFDKNHKSEVVVTDIRMTFPSMVVFIVKAVLAAIPAIIILVFLWVILNALFGVLIRH